MISDGIKRGYFFFTIFRILKIFVGLFEGVQVESLNQIAPQIYLEILRNQKKKFHLIYIMKNFKNGSFWPKAQKPKPQIK